MDLKSVQRLAVGGETEQVEFKKSTAQLKRAAETLCGFLNANGGQVLIGVTPEGKIVGQEVADSTLQDIAATLAKFEPAAPVSIKRIALEPRGEVIVLSAAMAFRGEAVCFRRTSVSAGRIDNVGHASGTVPELAARARPRPEAMGE